MTEIRYQTSSIPVAIDGPCPVCGRTFKGGDSITLTPPITHRACDPLASYLDNAISRDLAAISAQLDQELE